MGFEDAHKRRIVANGHEVGCKRLHDCGSYPTSLREHGPFEAADVAFIETFSRAVTLPLPVHTRALDIRRVCVTLARDGLRKG